MAVCLGADRFGRCQDKVARRFQVGLRPRSLFGYNRNRRRGLPSIIDRESPGRGLPDRSGTRVLPTTQNQTHPVSSGSHQPPLAVSVFRPRHRIAAAIHPDGAMHRYNSLPRQREIQNEDALSARVQNDHDRSFCLGLRCLFYRRIIHDRVPIDR